MNNFLLWLVTLANPLFKRYGVNTGQLGTILRYKLMVDDRSPSAFMGNRKSQGTNTGVWRTVIVTFFGLLAVAVLFISDQAYVGHTLYFVVFMFMISSTIITDFTNVLIDVRDNYTLLPRPVNDSTISISRILHICLHLSKIVIPFSLGGWIYTLIANGLISGGLFLIEVLSATLFCVFTVNAIYLLMMKLMRPEKFRDALVYFQVGFMMILLTAYYILPKIIDFEQVNTISLSDYWFCYIMPPFWISGLHELALGNINNLNIALCCLALVVPLICIVVVVKFLAPGFNKKIASIGVSDNVSQANAAEAPEILSPKTSYMEKLANWLCTSPLERAGFVMTWKLTGRIREFKTNSYPSFAFVPCYFVYFIFNGDNDQSFAEKWHDLPNGDSYLFVLYLISMLSIIVLQQIMRSEQHKASWVYYITPSKQPGQLLSGMLKAVLCKFHLPTLLAVCIFVFSVWGLAIGLNVLLAGINVLLVTIIFAFYLNRKFPFSQPSKISDQVGKMFLYMIFAVLPVGIGFLHKYLTQWPWAIILFIVLSATLTWYYFRQYFRLGWDKIA